jgi:hypothetical protein
MLYAYNVVLVSGNEQLRNSKFLRISPTEDTSYLGVYKMDLLKCDAAGRSSLDKDGRTVSRQEKCRRPIESVSEHSDLSTGHFCRLEAAQDFKLVVSDVNAKSISILARVAESADSIPWRKDKYGYRKIQGPFRPVAYPLALG